MGHWHLNSRDVEAKKKMFVGMGGVAGPPGDLQRVVFPGVVVILNLRAPAAPPTGGTDGSVVNHVGFTVQNVQESDCQMEGGRRTGATGRQQSAGSGLGHDAGWFAHRNPGEQELRSSQSSTSTCTSSCRKP